jgi:hypothetical protein
MKVFRKGDHVRVSPAGQGVIRRYNPNILGTVASTPRDSVFTRIYWDGTAIESAGTYHNDFIEKVDDNGCTRA